MWKQFKRIWTSLKHQHAFKSHSKGPGCPSSLLCPGSRLLQGSAESPNAVCHLPHFAGRGCYDFPHMGWAEPFFPHWELHNPCLVCLFPFPPAESHTWASFTPLLCSSAWGGVFQRSCSSPHQHSLQHSRLLGTRRASEQSSSLEINLTSAYTTAVSAPCLFRGEAQRVTKSSPLHQCRYCITARTNI